MTKEVWKKGRESRHEDYEVGKRKKRHVSGHHHQNYRDSRSKSSGSDMSSEKGVEKRHKRKRGNDGERYNDEKSCCRKRECKGCTGVGRHRERRCRSSSSSATHERDSELHSRRDGDGRDNCHWEKGACFLDGKRHHDRNKEHRRDHSNHQSRDSNDESAADRPAWATSVVLKRAEEIQQRKFIWSRSEGKKDGNSHTASTSTTAARPSTTATWNSILAASSSDSKQLDKFKRLMGMKKGDETGSTDSSCIDDRQIEAERKRQTELFSRLDKQYAIARSITHLSRGQGLGFH